MFLNERGQAFDAYRLLICGIMGLAVLLIILGAINYFEGLRVDVSRQRFFDGLGNAVNQPNGELLEMSGLYFAKGERFSSLSLAKQTGIEEQCLEFIDNGGLSFDVEPGLVKVNDYILADVEAKCSTNQIASCASGC